MLSKSELKENLSKCVAEITFNKVDGSARTMYCTLMSDYLPEQNAIDENGEAVYNDLDMPNLEKILASGSPFWLAGGFATPAKLLMLLNSLKI